MKTALRLVLAGGISLAAFGLGAGCVVHPHDQVDVVDAQGYHHHGYYDDHHVWHGGYVDEHNVHHDDPGDWQH
jgi:hypothetical protein